MNKPVLDLMDRIGDDKAVNAIKTAFTFTIDDIKTSSISKYTALKLSFYLLIISRVFCRITGRVILKRSFETSF